MTRYSTFLFLTLTLAAAPALRAQPTEIFGLNHTPLGSATLTEIPGGGTSTLLVSNIGSSGQDGVRVSAGPMGNVLDFLCVEVDEPAGVSPDFTFEAFDIGMPLMPVGTGRLRQLGGGYQFSALFPGVRGGSQRVSIYDDGVLVDEETISEGDGVGFGAWPTFVDPHKARPLPFPFPDFPSPTDSPVPQDGPWDVAFSLAFDQNIQFGLPGGPVVGDLLVVEPVQASTYEGLRRVEITATGVDKFTVRSEMVGAFGLPHVALGEASLDAEADRLTVGNLSSGGGVLVGGLPGQTPFDVEFEPFRLEAGDELLVQAFRNPQGPGDPGEVGAELLLRPEGQAAFAQGDTTESLGVWVNYRSTQTSDARVEVLDQKGEPKRIQFVPVDLDKLNRLFEVEPLTLGDPPGLARSAGTDAVRVERLGAITPPPFPAPFPVPESGFAGRFADGPVLFRFADGTAVEGFGFRAVAVDGQPLGNLSGLSFEVSNGFAARGAALGGLDELVIINEALAFPIVGVSAEPMAPPVVLPPGGGSFQWRFRGANASASPAAVTFRSEVVLPNGTVLPLLGPINTTLPGGVVVSRMFAQSVPASAPAGTYTYRVRGRLLDSTLVTDAFIFRKAPAALSSAGSDKGDWSIVEVIESNAAPAIVRSSESVHLTGYPNPTAGRTTLTFTLNERAEVRLAVYDVLGREVAVLRDNAHDAGRHEVVFDASDLPSGIYLVRLDAGGTVQTQRITLI